MLLKNPMVFALLLRLAALAAVNALPFLVTVNNRAKECLYEQLNAGESATASAFILQGSELKATLAFEGPILPASGDSGVSLREAIDTFERDARRGRADHSSEVIRFTMVLDLDHLNDLLDEEEDLKAEDDEYDDDDQGEEGNTEELQAKQRRKVLERRNRQEQKKQRKSELIREAGEVYEKTFRAHVAGWYRFCMEATFNEVVVEMDIRRESELGGMDKETGHVWTFEEKQFAAEDVLIEEDTANEEGIRDEDFVTTKEKLRKLRELLADVQTKQAQDRHRLVMHASANEHSHSRMVLGSLLETIVYMAVTGFQIMTIRRWFKQAPVLGR